MEDDSMSDEIVKAKIRRALLSGPDIVTREATVVEMRLDNDLRSATQEVNSVHPSTI
jgi:hypothetical protein